MLGAFLGEGAGKVPEGASCAIDGSSCSESCFAIRAVYREKKN